MNQAVLVEDEIEYQIALSEALKLDAKQWSINYFTRGKEAVAFYADLKTPPRIAIVDIGLPDISGLEVIKKFKERAPLIPILVYTIVPSEHVLKAAVTNGASGYILKDDKHFSVFSAIQEILEGHSPISPRMTKPLMSNLRKLGLRSKNAPKLSTQEQILLELISVGNSYAIAAHSMGLSVNTVHAYSRSLFRKLNINSKTQAIIKAREFGLIE